MSPMQPSPPHRIGASSRRISHADPWRDARACAWLASALALVWILGAAGCKDSSEPDPELVDKTAGLTQEQESLLQRRDAVLNSRRKLREKREALAAERREVLAQGGDTSALDEKVAELSREEAQLSEREEALDRDLDSLFTEQRTVLSAIASKGGEAAQLSAREGSMASREKLLSEREAKLAQREADLAERERTLAERERDTCGAGAPMMPTIVQAPPPAGTEYDKKDVEPVLQRARRRMNKKGILASDLPAPARGLEKEATAAMKKGDYGSAHFAAKQLLSTVEATRIDRAFIQAKIGRLNQDIEGKQLDADKQKQVDKLFREATRSYGDGKYTRANKRLNEIYASIR